MNKFWVIDLYKIKAEAYVGFEDSRWGAKKQDEMTKVKVNIERDILILETNDLRRKIKS